MNVKNKSAIKVLIVTYYWPPSGGAGVQRCLKFVKHLPEFGIEPTVVTVKEDEASYPVIDNSLQQDVPDNVRVIRTSTTEPFEYYKKLTGKKEIPFGGFANDKNESFTQKIFKFLRGNLFIPDPRVGWNRHALKAIKKLLKEEQFDAVITSSPPHSTQLIGLKLKKKFPDLKWIADMRDPWTDIYYYNELNHTALAKKLDASYEKDVIQHADAMMVVSDDMKRMFLNKAVTISPDKIQVVPNGFDEADFVYPSAPSKDEFIITYTGTITEVYNIEAFLKALATVRQQNPQIKYKLRFVGKIAQQVLRQIQQAGLEPVTEIVPYVPHEESIQYMMQSTMLLMAIPDVPNNFGIVTGKLFEYLASNKPIICIGPIHSDVDAIIDECGAGRVFHYAAYDVMVDHLMQMSQSWKINPNLDLPFINYNHYSRRALTEKLAKLIKE
ncbi:MAG: glycosyltransferase family 4 protein [Hymenobacteraceae bacterium]|nr:glycosyltransferase family 4 protein [Hymenobacteraceae bacterium]MDX5397229.1 glycosyltransferase family 4 protein [Hymenobacteraceae bacterium]MDX5513305.1 glycosyltransferase family 4 protein [Hymenobacteraceae bacterium]